MEASEIISMTQRAKSNYDSAKEQLKKATNELQPFCPIVPGKEQLARIMTECEGKTYSKTYLFVAVCILLFSPIAITGGALSIHVAKAMASYLGTTYNNVYMVRYKVVVWINNYKDFYNEVNDIIKTLLSEDNTNGGQN